MTKDQGTYCDLLVDPIFMDDEIAATLNSKALLQAMLDVEAALARAEADAGVIPKSAVRPIAAACRAEIFDRAALGKDAADSGNLAIPLVKALTAAVDGDAKRYVHWGATSQDIIDTAVVMQIRNALALIDGRLARLADVLAAQAERHRKTPMVARTWLQHALPTTFGLKAAGWLDMVTRHRARLDEMRPRVLTLQFGGAAGTLASLGDAGIAVTDRLAHHLGLEAAAAPWHAARDRMAEVATFAGLMAGTLGKIARDVSLMMQTDVAEAFEAAAPGRGGSSTMPHKRNPVACASILAVATMLPSLVATMLAAQVQDHERAAGPWTAEWRTLPEILRLAGGAVLCAAEMLDNLEVDAARMRENLDRTNGLVMAEAVMMALGRAIGRLEAHHVVEAASRKALAANRHLGDVLAADASVTKHLDEKSLRSLLDPLAYLGSADAFIGRVLAAHAEQSRRKGDT